VQTKREEGKGGRKNLRLRFYGGERSLLLPFIRKVSQRDFRQGGEDDRLTLGKERVLDCGPRGGKDLRYPLRGGELPRR